MRYVSLKKLYYKDNQNHQQIYQQRFNAPFTEHINIPRIISFVSKISALYTKLIFLFTTKYFSMKLDFLMLQ